MTEENLTTLLAAVKAGMSIPVENTYQDDLLKQKIKGNWSYMKNAGVDESLVEDDETIAALTIGVTDMWTMENGKAKYSQMFNTMVTQLAMRVIETEEV